jgi:hypothetical protein
MADVDPLLFDRQDQALALRDVNRSIVDCQLWHEFLLVR